MGYSVNMQDIKNYVASVPEDAKVGEPNHCYACLVAETLYWKYQDQGVAVRVHQLNRGATVNGDDIEFPLDVFEAAEKFDDIPFGMNVTRAVLREHMPELFSL